MSESRQPDPDPEIEALLQFEPVHRHTRRHDGWSPERQRAFIAALARLGDVDRAAHGLGRTGSGAWKVRRSGGAEGFSDAWDGALDLFHRRNPELSRRGGRAIPGARGGPPLREAEPEEAELDLESEWEVFSRTILETYLMKLSAKREARLGGRIVEADFIVRQLTWVEVVLDLGELGPRAIELLNGLKRGDLDARRITATPMSSFLGQLRRKFWACCGEPERPADAPLGRHDDQAATGPPMESQHWPERDGATFGHSVQREEYLRRNAEAQRAWEERARAEAEAWRSSLAGQGDPDDGTAQP